MKTGLLAAVIIGAMAFGSAGQAADPETLSAARQKLIDAYGKADYAMLCSLLDKDASFRGSVKPDQWTIGADAIIVDRWGASQTCSGQPRTAAHVSSVPTHTLALNPDFKEGVSQSLTTGSGATARVAVDFGAMDMLVRNYGSGIPNYNHRYMMIWRDDGSGWKLTHIDMFAPF